MGSGRNRSEKTDLFSTAARREPVSPLTPPPSTAESLAAPTSRHVLPSDLPTAIRLLDDQELDQLFAAVIAERLQRGMKPPAPDKNPNKRSVKAIGISLTPGKLSAVRAAFKAGVSPTKIAKEFGVSQADVRKVIADVKG